MPIDFSFETVPHFRDITHTGLVLFRRPVVRSIAKLRLLRAGRGGAESLPHPAKPPAGTR